MHVIFFGDVQGVGFRATARRFALHLGLVGYVCNLPDGTIELLAQGSKEQLQSLLDQLNKNFNISKIEQKYQNSSASYNQFLIR